MNELIQLVVFCLDEQRYALPLAAVERTVRAVEVTPLPDAPPIVLGVIDVEGRVLPVLNIRRRFRLPEREVRPVDQFVIAQTVRRTVALVIDEAQGVIERPESAVVNPAQIVPGLEQIFIVVAAFSPYAVTGLATETPLPEVPTECLPKWAWVSATAFCRTNPGRLTRCVSVLSRREARRSCYLVPPALAHDCCGLSARPAAPPRP